MKCSNLSYLEIQLLHLSSERVEELEKSNCPIIDAQRKDLNGKKQLIYDTYWLNHKIKKILTKKLEGH